MKPVPLHPWVAEALLEWKRTAPYNQPDDWVFGSPRMKGKQPYSPDMILSGAFVRLRSPPASPSILAGTRFRHTFSTLLKASGVEAMSPEKRGAQARVVEDVFTGK
jgi:integrase